MADNKTQIIITAKDETRSAIASAQRGLESLASAGSGLRNSFSFLAGAGGIAGLIGGAGLSAVVKTTIDDLDKLNESAERVGVSVESLSALNFAGKLNGVDFDDMTTALTKLSVKMQDAASGSKDASAVFSDLGVKVTDSSGKLKSADAVFAEVSEKFSEMEDGAGKTAFAVDIFGKSGAKLVPLLNQGAGGLEKMRKEAESLGAVISGKLAQQADEFNDNLDRLGFLSKSVGISITSELLPALNRLTSEFLEGITASGGFWAALNAGATLNPFANVGENLKTVRGELAKMEADVKDYGYMDEERYKRKINQLKMLEAADARLKAQQAKSLGIDDIEGLVDKKKPPKRTPVDEPQTKTGRAAADEAARLIQQLNEQIALKGLDAESTDKLTAAEQQRAKVLYQLDAGTLKASASQREKIAAALDELVVLDRTLQAQKEFTAAVTKQEEANYKARDSMLGQIAAATEAANLYGLNESQISAVEQARLADAIAMAKQNGASEDQIAYLEEELRLRSALTDALIGKQTKANEIEEAKKAIDAVSELDQFTVQAARNMQTAFADFLFDPFADGMQGMVKGFADAVRRMAADALAAQILKKLFGDMGKTGEVGADSWVGMALNAVGLFADGGIMTDKGPLPLNKYASGGIANTPQLAMFGEGRTPEAYVPLPDGRRIPVAMSGGGQAQPQNIRIVNAFDNSVIGDYLGSSAGEKIIMNAVQRNAGAFRQALA